MKIIEKDVSVSKNYVKSSLVMCDCGNIFTLQNSKVNYQKYCKECKKESSTTHNMSYTKFYRTWSDVKTRGSNRYSVSNCAVGLSKNWEVFVNFKKDMYETYLMHVSKHGEKNTTIDRIDNSKGYFKENCRWATYEEQNKNRSISILIDGQTVSEIAKKNNLSYSCVYFRYKSGKKGDGLLKKSERK